jgi:hypothetical protein
MCVAEWEHSRGRSYDIKACRPQRHLAGGVGWVGEHYKGSNRHTAKATQIPAQL